jgi:hypothetical protein
VDDKNQAIDEDWIMVVKPQKGFYYTGGTSGQPGAFLSDPLSNPLPLKKFKVGLPKFSATCFPISKIKWW